MRLYIPVSDQMEVAFDFNNPHVGMPDGQLVLTGPSKGEVTVPFSLVGSGTVPDGNQIATKVNEALNEERWMFSVTGVRVAE